MATAAAILNPQGGSYYFPGGGEVAYVLVAPAYLRDGQVVLETDKARFGTVSPAAWKDIVRAPAEFPWLVVLGGFGGCVLLLGVFCLFLAA